MESLNSRSPSTTLLSVENISTKGPLTYLGCARDDKEGDASMESGCWTEGVFHHIRWAKGP